jgi:hypothetical protein
VRADGSLLPASPTSPTLHPKRPNCSRCLPPPSSGSTGRAMDGGGNGYPYQYGQATFVNVAASGSSGYWGDGGGINYSVGNVPNRQWTHAVAVEAMPRTSMQQQHQYQQQHNFFINNNCIHQTQCSTVSWPRGGAGAPPYSSFIPLTSIEGGEEDYPRQVLHRISFYTNIHC